MCGLSGLQILIVNSGGLQIRRNILPSAWITVGCICLLALYSMHLNCGWTVFQVVVNAACWDVRPSDNSMVSLCKVLGNCHRLAACFILSSQAVLFRCVFLRFFSLSFTVLLGVKWHTNALQAAVEIVKNTLILGIWDKLKSKWDKFDYNVNRKCIIL